MSQIDVRLCEAADLKAVSRLLGETWHATYDAIYGVDRVSDITRRWHSVEVLTSNLEAANGIFLVAERGDELVGTAFARIAEEVAMLMCDRIYVHPDAQGLGVGYALLGGLIVRAGSAEKVCLEVEPENAQAIAFYERAGFKVVGRGTDCGGQNDNIEHLIMERTL